MATSTGLEIALAAEDLRAKWYEQKRNNDKTAFAPIWAQYAKYYEAKIEEGKDFFINNEVCYADVTVYDTFEQSGEWLGYDVAAKLGEVGAPRLRKVTTWSWEFSRTI